MISFIVPVFSLLGLFCLLLCIGGGSYLLVSAARFISNRWNKDKSNEHSEGP